jgi:hypothetical protein
LITQQRKSDLRKLRQSIRGELDWIVMKCLDKDRNRRYDSAGSLARDIERYLQNEPVQACPPSAIYRFRKFVRRNKVALLSLAVVAVGIGLSIVLAMAGASIVALKQKNLKLQGYRPVLVTTEPKGARVALVPIDERTGELTSDRKEIIRPSAFTPLTLDLKPRRYLVEAVLFNEKDTPDFAEVEVFIPSSETKADSTVESNRNRGKPEDLYFLPTIMVPETSKLISEMVAVPIDDDLRRRKPFLPELLLVDAKETSARRNDRAVTSSFELATRAARDRGLRLPTAAEYDAMVNAAKNQLLRYSNPQRPATLDDLFDDLAEWTTTKYNFRGSGQSEPSSRLQTMHILKGYGDPSKLPGLVRMPDAVLATPDSSSPLIGFRCVRSETPRFVTRGSE